MVTCPTCGTKKHGNNYTEVVLDLKNGSKMPIAVCLEDKDKIHLHDKGDMMQAVQEGWRHEQIRDNWTKEKMAAYEDVHGKLEFA